MPIGTAAPHAEQLAAVPHHLVGFLDPGERYSAARFASDAVDAIAEILRRGKRAIVVGGTGFYIRALTAASTCRDATTMRCALGSRARRCCIRRNSYTAGSLSTTQRARRSCMRPIRTACYARSRSHSAQTDAGGPAAPTTLARKPRPFRGCSPFWTFPGANSIGASRNARIECWMRDCSMKPSASAAARRRRTRSATRKLLGTCAAGARSPNSATALIERRAATRAGSAPGFAARRTTLWLQPEAVARQVREKLAWSAKRE